MRPKGNQAAAVLTSGGVESAALVAEALKRYERVYPIYVRQGLQWEKEEMRFLKGFLKLLHADGLADLTLLEVPVAPIYGHHWSLGKGGTPSFKAPDEAVYLPGRNLLLLSLSGLFCTLKRIPTLWIGILKGNPFHDARTGFLHEMERILEEATAIPIRIAYPFAELTKSQVIRRNPDLAWERTFSCIKPKGNEHCGRCQKCAERRKGFQAAGIPDPTRYAA